MVSLEEEDSSDVEILDHPWPKAVSSGKKCSPEPITGKEKTASSSSAHLESQFIEMGFSPTLVDKVIQENSEGDANILLQALFKHTEVSSETSGLLQKKRCLKEMGFTEDEVSRAIDNFGSEVQIFELADAIFADRIASTVAAEEHKENKNASDGRPRTEDLARGLYQETNGRHIDISASVSPIYDANEFRRKRGSTSDARTPLNNNRRKEGRWLKEDIRFHSKTSQNIEMNHLAEGSSLKTERPEQAIPTLRKKVLLQSKPPYLFYGNAVDISKETWKKLSQFLYTIEPELADTQYFSAITRNEGYIHNLPRSERVHIHPMPPMTIEAALPYTKKWWPSWDTRKKLCCISSDFKEVSIQVERLNQMIKSSHEMINKEKKMEILSNCQIMNLIWTGQHKLSPITPEEMECILGYPREHTDICRISVDERLRKLMNCFQIDTVSYHLSVLKDLYPKGMNVLSIFSGVGGAEVALHRLGIHLKCVVSVEPVESNREILRKWWQKSRQGGELIQIEDIRGMSMKKLEGIIKDIGAFDIVIGSNPCPPLPKIASCDDFTGLDFALFNEFVRVYKQVRSLMIKSL